MHLLVCVRMHSHYVRERCTAVCSIASEQRRHHSKQHVNMPPARAQEHKWRKAHTYQNTTHGAASCIIPGIWYPLSTIFIISFFVVGTPCGFVIYAGFPLPTRHTLNATSKLVTARIHVHSTQICMMVSGHWAQSTKRIR